MLEVVSSSSLESPFPLTTIQAFSQNDEIKNFSKWTQLWLSWKVAKTRFIYLQSEPPVIITQRNVYVCNVNIYITFARLYKTIDRQRTQKISTHIMRGIALAQISSEIDLVQNSIRPKKLKKRSTNFFCQKLSWTKIERKISGIPIGIGIPAKLAVNHFWAFSTRIFWNETE